MHLLLASTRCSWGLQPQKAMLEATGRQGEGQRWQQQYSDLSAEGGSPVEAEEEEATGRGEQARNRLGTGKQGRREQVGSPAGGQRRRPVVSLPAHSATHIGGIFLSLLPFPRSL